jgi:hypothetical protein
MLNTSKKSVATVESVQVARHEPSHDHELGNCIPCSHLFQHLQHEGQEYQPTNDEHRHRGVFFGDARQMVGGGTNKLTAAGLD